MYVDSLEIEMRVKGTNKVADAQRSARVGAEVRTYIVDTPIRLKFMQCLIITVAKYLHVRKRK